MTLTSGQGHINCLLHHVTFTLNKFYVAVSNSLEGDVFTRKINYLTFDLGVNVTQNIANYPLHYVIYASAKFEVAKSNDL